MSDMNVYNTPTWNYKLFEYLWRTKNPFKTVEILKYYGYSCLQKKVFANFAQITSFNAKSKIRPSAKQKRTKCASSDNPGNNILRILHEIANFWEKVSSLTLDSEPGKSCQQKNQIGSGSLGTRLLNTAKFISINSNSKFLSS